MLRSALASGGRWILDNIIQSVGLLASLKSHQAHTISPLIVAVLKVETDGITEC